MFKTSSPAKNYSFEYETYENQVYNYCYYADGITGESLCVYAEAVQPVIGIANTTLIQAGGDGTASNPFVIS